MELEIKDISMRDLAQVVREKATEDEVHNLLLDVFATLTIVEPAHKKIVTESMQIGVDLFNKYKSAKFEVGKSYLTRDGRTIKLLIDTNHEQFPLVGIIDGSNQTFSFTRKGRFHKDDSKLFETSLDLMEEVETNDD